jgi:hypothetical protein
MPQYAHPDADTVIGNYTDQAGGTTSIFQTIDESVTPSDADFIRSPASPSSEVYVCRLSDVSDPLGSANHVMHMRTSCDLDDQQTLSFTQQLRQGYVSEGNQGTLIASQARTGVTSSAWTTSSYTLSGAEADAITDYTTLFYRFILTAS